MSYKKNHNIILKNNDHISSNIINFNSPFSIKPIKSVFLSIYISTYSLNDAKDNLNPLKLFL